MILPISNSFKTLKTRIECVKIAPFSLPSAMDNKQEEPQLDIEKCIKIFDDKVAVTEAWKKQKMMKKK
jgi:hypothetical protein